ncbi:MAG: hypothetical protein ACYTFY_16890, partial [Planctomycetota bacterium]
LDKPVTAVTGHALRSLTDQEIKDLFSRGVLLDGKALESLIEMGHEDLAGVGIKGMCEKRSIGIGPEEMTDPEFGGGKFNYSWSYGMWPEYILEPEEGSRMISRIVDPFGEFLFPGFTLFENESGGRVAVCPFNLGGEGLDHILNRANLFFYTEYRKEQIQKVVEWLGKGDIPLIVEADGWILPHRGDKENEILFAAMNMNADVWEKLSFTASINGQVDKVNLIDIDGEIKKLSEESWSLSDDRITVNIAKEIPHLRTVGIQILLK